MRNIKIARFCILHHVRTIIILMKNILIVFSICLSFLVGCTSKEPTPPPKKQPAGRVLAIGLIPEQDIFKQMERYKPLAEYIFKKTGYKIELLILPRYGDVIDHFVSKNMDGAFFGSFVYTLAHARIGVEVLARPENLKGVSTYHGLIFVRKDSGIRTVKDMKGKRFAFVDKATTAGYLLPLAYFRENNITDYTTFFRETYFTGTHDSAIYDVLDGKADIGAAKNTIYEKLEEADSRVKEKLLILKKSPDVPENALGLRKDIDEAVRMKLKEVLLGMDNDPEGKDVLKQFGARRFIETTNDDYEPVISYCKYINLNLSTFDYMNE
jgi:phosphonate transport system substrate-binding protein